MSAFPVEIPYPLFTDADGSPLENGYIFIGQSGLNAQTNPINIYWDANSTQPAAQPIRTLNGYAVYNGTPSRFFANEDYSIIVKNSKGMTVFSALTYDYFPAYFGTVANANGNGVLTTFAVPSRPSNIYINGVYQQQNTYSVVGTNVVFSQAPPFNSSIEFVFG
jgi:hypothetical protein